MNTELVISLSGTRKSRSQWLRFRLSKLYYDEVEFNSQELEYLFYIIFDLAEANDQQLDKRLKGKVQVLNCLLEFHKMLGVANAENKRKIMFYCGSILLTPHEYYGLKNGNLNIEKPLSLLYSVKRKEKVKYPEQRRIGVGYRDKGNAQKVAIDGSMNWEYYSTLTDDIAKDLTSVSRLLTEGSKLMSEIDDEIEDYFHDF